MKFSRKKFSDFSTGKKNRILEKFIIEIERNWQLTKKRISLLQEFSNCLIWSDHLDQETIGLNISPDLTYEKFLEIVVPLEQLVSGDVRDKDILILKEDGLKEIKNTLPVVLLLHNLRSAFNVGAIFRTAECLQIEKIYLSGYTPTPENPKLRETAMGTDRRIEWQKVDDPFSLLVELKSNDYRIYALETTAEAESIYKADLDFPCCLILGNEALGITEVMLRKADRILRIPVRGWKNSLNVGVAFAVCGYEILRRSEL